MPNYQSLLSLIAGALLCGGCAAAADPPSRSAPEPEPVAELAPAVEPEPTLEERWRAPFAVRSTGTPAPRGPVAQVVIESGERRTAEVARDTAAPPARQQEAPTQRQEAPAQRATSTAPPRTTTPTSGTRAHTVTQGETWLGIARRYGITAAALATANPQVDPERIRTGQVLQIPGAVPAPAAARRTHVVGQGDTLWSIARRYGVAAEQIRTVNRLPDERVRIGQTLIIP